MTNQTSIKSLKPAHETIIDWLLEHPGKQDMAQLAAHAGYTRSWLSTVMHSDVFLEEYTIRRQMHSMELTSRVAESQLKLTLKALDKVDMFLDDDDEVDIRSALEVADRTAKHLGFSARPGLSPLIEETKTREIRTVSSGVLKEARETIKRVTYVQNSQDN